MALVDLTLPVVNSANLVRFYDRIQVFRSTTGPTGPWIEITTPATRPALAADKVAYEFEDANGDANYYYAAGFINATTGAISPPGDPVPGSGDVSLQILSIDDLKQRYLFGLNLLDPLGNEMTDAMFQFWIAGAVSYFEKLTDIVVRPNIILDEQHDYIKANDASQPQMFKTNKVPVQSVQGVRLTLPYRSGIQNLPKEWINLRPQTGRITLYPVGQFTYPIGLLSGMSPYGGYMLQDIIPGGWRVDYVAGFAVGQVPVEIQETIGKLASFGPLNLAGDLIGGAGIASQSLGIDGLSQSINTTSSSMFSGYGARLKQYQGEIARSIGLIKATYRGLSMLGM